jgi:hypothetical protein
MFKKNEIANLYKLNLTFFDDASPVAGEPNTPVDKNDNLEPPKPIIKPKTDDDVFKKGFGVGIDKGRIEGKAEGKKEAMNEFFDQLKDFGITPENLSQKLSLLANVEDSNKAAQQLSMKEKEYQLALESAKKEIDKLAKENSKKENEFESYKKNTTIKNALEKAVNTLNTTNPNQVIKLIQDEYKFIIDDKGKVKIDSDKLDDLYFGGEELTLDKVIDRWLSKDENQHFKKSRMMQGTNFGGGTGSNGVTSIKTMEEYNKYRDDILKNPLKYDIRELTKKKK